MKLHTIINNLIVSHNLTNNQSELAPAAERSEPTGIASGVPGKKIAYTAGTCDATPDQ